MGRRERRAAGITGKVATYQMTQKQLDAMSAESYRLGVRNSMANVSALLLSVSCLALRDSHGFGIDRLSKFLDRAMFLLSAIADGDMEFSDCMATLKEEVGIDMVEEGQILVLHNLNGDCMEKTLKYGIAKECTGAEPSTLSWITDEGDE